MTRINGLAIFLLWTTFSVGVTSMDASGAPDEAATIWLEGRVKLIRVHLCGLEPGRCEGFVVLATAATEEVSLAIMPGMRIERSKQLVMLDELQVGDYVEVQALQVAGEPLPRIVTLEITPH